MKIIFTLATTQILVLLLTSCSDIQGKEPVKENQDANLIRAAEIFESSSTKVSPNLVPCTLSGGTETTCLSITVSTTQTEHKIGPWCPRNISDGAEKSGIWPDGGKVYDADGQFVKNLSVFYKDDQWQLFNPETGVVNVTDSKEACIAAARLDVDPKYYNYCVECETSYVDDHAGFTYVIPVKPVLLVRPQRVDPHSGVGVAYNGVRFGGPAPVQVILGAHTLAPFDDCGGHVNPHVGYHYHAATGCTKEVASTNGHASMIGYAFDGFMLHDRLNADGSEPTDLDACRGHEFGSLGYHYHVNDPGKNQIIGCFQAEQGCALEGDKQICEFPRRRPPPPGNQG